MGSSRSGPKIWGRCHCDREGKAQLQRKLFKDKRRKVFKAEYTFAIGRKFFPENTYIDLHPLRMEGLGSPRHRLCAQPQRVRWQRHIYMTPSEPPRCGHRDTWRRVLSPCLLPQKSSLHCCLDGKEPHRPHFQAVHLPLDAALGPTHGPLRCAKVSAQSALSPQPPTTATPSA